LIFFSVPGLAADKQGCLMRMIDNLKVLDVLLESRSQKTEDGAVLYTVSSDFAAETPWVEYVTVPSEKEPIETGRGCAGAEHQRDQGQCKGTFCA